MPRFSVEVYITEVRSAKIEIEADTARAARAEFNQLHMYGALDWEPGETTDVSYCVQPIIAALTNGGTP